MLEDTFANMELGPVSLPKVFELGPLGSKPYMLQLNLPQPRTTPPCSSPSLATQLPPCSCCNHLNLCGCMFFAAAYSYQHKPCGSKV